MPTKPPMRYDSGSESESRSTPSSPSRSHGLLLPLPLFAHPSPAHPSPAPPYVTLPHTPSTVTSKKVALVVGRHGIGLEIAKKLAELMNVAITHISDKGGLGAERATHIIKGQENVPGSHKVHHFKFDPRVSEGATPTVQEVVNKLGGIDVVIFASTSIYTSPSSKKVKIFQTEVSAFYALYQVGPSSLGCSDPNADVDAAIEALVRALGEELRGASKDATVNAVVRDKIPDNDNSKKVTVTDDDIVRMVDTTLTTPSGKLQGLYRGHWGLEKVEKASGPVRIWTCPSPRPASLFASTRRLSAPPGLTAPDASGAINMELLEDALPVYQDRRMTFGLLYLLDRPPPRAMQPRRGVSSALHYRATLCDSVTVTWSPRAVTVSAAGGCCAATRDQRDGDVDGDAEQRHDAHIGDRSDYG
ncbi:hypothetical protein BJV78DRAFT_1157632 [Lactifluus subvellereus]|nr:hypothetical protein BJV78DRAFT_1157632 [Lactifluus subvellereus]